MKRRKLITKTHLRHAYRTICWFYSGKVDTDVDGNVEPIPHDYMFCFYLDFNDNIYKSIVNDFRKG